MFGALDRKRSVNKVAKLVCLSRDEETILKTLAGKVEDASRKEGGYGNIRHFVWKKKGLIP